MNLSVVENTDVYNMEFGEPLKALGEVDTHSLINAILNLPEEMWVQTPRLLCETLSTQNTRSVLMVYTEGSGWPNIEVRKESGWDALQATAVPVMHSLLARHYGADGTIIRAMATRLPAGESMQSGNEQHPSFHHSHRVTIPIVSNFEMQYSLDGAPCALKVGKAYEINHASICTIDNASKLPVITFTFDYVPAHSATRNTDFTATIAQQV